MACSLARVGHARLHHLHGMVPQSVTKGRPGACEGEGAYNNNLHRMQWHNKLIKIFMSLNLSIYYRTTYT